MNQETKTPDVSEPTCRLLVVRTAGATVDGWDQRAAVVAVDGIDRAELRIGQEVELLLMPGEHQLAIRLLYHFAPATIAVVLKPQQTTIVTCSKGSASFLDLLSPGRYWQLSETVEPEPRR